MARWRLGVDMRRREFLGARGVLGGAGGMASDDDRAFVCYFSR
jgi:hypothetical protein